MSASTKDRGDQAELAVAADLTRQGHTVAIPFGDKAAYDLVVDRAGVLERVQVKYARSEGIRLEIPCRSHSLTNGKVRRVRHYTSESIDWLAVYDATTSRCFYVPAEELGTGRSFITLRLAPETNNQRQGIRHAEEYASLH